MINIRLQRRGRKNDPSFRVIVVDSKKKPKTGLYLEMVGSYDPRVDRADLKPERILAWIGQGAQPSDTVHNLLVDKKIIEGTKINVLPKSLSKGAKKKVETANATKEAAAQAEAKAKEEAAAAAKAAEVVEAPAAEENVVAEEPAAE
jgi:small subunit ribosomal protein S16